MNSNSNETIRTIQDDVLSQMLWERNIAKTAPGNVLREEYLAAINESGRFLLLKLLWVASDTDFIYFAYRLFLRREPDRDGFVRYREALCYKRLKRIEILNLINGSDEMQASGRKIPGLVRANRLHRFFNRFRRVPVLGPMPHWLWCILTIGSYRQRMEMMLAEVDRDLLQTRLRSIDTLEYLHNQSRLADRAPARSQRLSS